MRTPPPPPEDDTRSAARTITVATFVRSLGRGAFYTLVTLYLVQIVSLPVAEVTVALAVANGAGVVGAFAGGRAADTWSARHIVRVSFVVEGVALGSYSLVTGFPSALVVAVLVAFANKVGSSAMSALIARAFDGPDRVRVRATARVVTNVGIALGSGVAAVPLAVGGAMGYRVVMVAAACAYLAAALICSRLPQSGDATAEHRLSADGTHHPWQDRRYVALTVFSGVFVLQFAIAEVAMPVWIAQHTSAPTVMVSVLLILNTAFVMSLQIPLSRNTHDVGAASRAVVRGGLLLAASCGAFAATQHTSKAPTIVILVCGAILMALGEVLQQSGVFGLSFELAPVARAGAYQGFFTMGTATAQCIAPLVIGHTILASPTVGWAVIAVLFVAAGFGTLAVTRTGERSADSSADITAAEPSRR